MSNKILTKDEEIYEIARDFCRLNCSCEECSLVGTRNRDKCKAKIYARRAYEKGYKKRTALPIAFMMSDEQIEKIKNDVLSSINIDVGMIFADIEKAYIEAKEADMKFEMGFEYEWNKRLDELKKKYEVTAR